MLSQSPQSEGTDLRLEEMRADCSLHGSEAEATLVTSQVPADVARRDAERLSPGWELVAILCVCALAGLIGVSCCLEEHFLSSD